MLQVVAQRQRHVLCPPPTLIVRTLSARATTGMLEFGGLRFACALGRSGRKVGKREGDGASPTGTFALREVFYRADRVVRPRSGLKLRAISRNDGWCDASGDRNYNRQVRHPYSASAEHLWREDGLYDLIVVLGYNDSPRIKGRGSAIFLHCASDRYAPTQGCIALKRSDLVALLTRVRRRARVQIG